jgi:hypothetical protein
MKMFRLLPPRLLPVAVIGLTLFFVFTAFSLWTRAVWERDNTTVELCVDGEEVGFFYRDSDSRVAGALATLSEMGVSSVGVLWNTEESLRDLLRVWTARLPREMSLTLRPQADPFTEDLAGLLRRRLPPDERLSAAPVKNLLFAGPAVAGYPNLTIARDWIASTAWFLPSMEFGRQMGGRALAETFPERVIRGHTLDEDEMTRLTPEDAVARLRRAARERGVRFLYARFFPGLSVEGNMAYVRALSHALKEDGFTLGPARPRRSAWTNRAWLFPLWARQFCAFLTATFLPVLAFAWVRRRSRSVWSTTELTTLTLGAGLLTEAFLSAPDFALGMERFRGVEASVTIPMILTFVELYRWDELKKNLRKSVTVRAAVLLALAVGTVAVLSLRTGPSPWGVWVHEARLKGWLEFLFDVRPRLKEVLLGHPALWVGFYLSSARRPRWKAAWAWVADPRPWLFVGMVGQVSLVNSFCYPVLPMELALIRALYGYLLGALIGAALIGAFKLACKFPLTRTIQLGP